MRDGMKTIIAICMSVSAASVAGAQDFFYVVEEASPTEVQEAIDAGADVNARTELG